MIAQGTVQKIVTDVTSTTQGFANDTATGLRAQADSADQLESDLAGRAGSMLSDGGSSLPDGSFTTGGFSSAASSPLATSVNGGLSTTVDGSPTAYTSPSQESVETGDVSAPGVGESGLSEAGTVGQEEPQQSSAMPFGGMRGGSGAAGAGDERGQRPNYLKSRIAAAEGNGDRVKAAVDKHRQECGMAPIPFSTNRLVCAKCGSILEIGDAQTLSA
jgi:hypothetical protein